MTQRDSRAYLMAFRYGAMGSIILGLYAIVGNLLAGLVALTIWMLVTIFLLPWGYILGQKLTQWG